jgi:hypothetical protein
MFKLAIVAAILPAIAWWCTTHFAQAAMLGMRVIFPATYHQLVV